MPRLAVSSLLLLTVVGSPACRPSKADIVAIQTQLDQIQSQQDALAEQLAVVAEIDEGQRRELARLDAAVAGMKVKVVELDAEAQARAEAEAKAKANRPARPDPEAVYKVPIGDCAVKGRDDALVTIVMWTDYQCPYCARVQATLRQIEDAYGRKVRFVHKHNPLGFHPRAMPAAIAAEAAHRQGKFWEMSELLFDHQKDLTDENFRKWAKKLRLDARRFKRDLKDPELREHIEDDQELGVSIGARGTPAFFVNGRFLSGAQPFANFETLIDEELKKARALVDRGVPKRKLYETIIAEGRTKV